MRSISVTKTLVKNDPKFPKLSYNTNPVGLFELICSLHQVSVNLPAYARYQTVSTRNVNEHYEAMCGKVAAYVVNGGVPFTTKERAETMCGKVAVLLPQK